MVRRLTVRCIVSAKPTGYGTVGGGTIGSAPQGSDLILVSSVRLMDVDQVCREPRAGRQGGLRRTESASEANGGPSAKPAAFSVGHCRQVARSFRTLVFPSASGGCATCSAVLQGLRETARGKHPAQCQAHSRPSRPSLAGGCRCD